MHMSDRCVRRRRIARGLLTASLLASPLLSLVFGGTVHAHARYVSSKPEQGGFVTSAPPVVKISFSEEVRISGSSISVQAPGGAEVNAGPSAFDGSDRKTLAVPLKSGLVNGLYTVNWVSVSDQDGDIEQGAFNFGLRANTAPPSIMVDRALADTGEMVTFTGDGFKPNGAIVVSAGDDDQFVEGGKADAAGRVSIGVRVPGDLPYGKQPFTIADGDGAKAVQDVLVRWGGWPPVKVQVVASAGKDDVAFAVTLVNRSDYQFGVGAARLKLPDGTTFKSADLGGRQTAFGEASWDAIELPARGSVGPLTVTLDTTKLQDGTDVTAWAWVQFSHLADKAEDGTVLPAFTSNAVSKPATARAGRPR
jgi:methionine-rich copper-binding protein CopC